MVFKEPKVEFVELDLKETIITTSPGADIHMCSGGGFDDECDPGNAGSL